MAEYVEWASMLLVWVDLPVIDTIHPKSTWQVCYGCEGVQVNQNLTALQ